VVRVALHGGVAQEVREFLESEPGALLLLPMDTDTRQGKSKPGTTTDGQPSNNWLGRALKKPLPCDMALVQMPKEGYKGDSPTAPFETGMRILLPVRGGPQAELAIRLSQAMTEAIRAQVAVLHLVHGDMPERERASEEAPFNELLESLGSGRVDGESAANVRHIYATSQNATASIGRVAEEYDLVVIGAGGDEGAEMGGFSKMVARASTPALLALKTRVPVGPAIRAARKRARPGATSATCARGTSAPCPTRGSSARRSSRSIASHAPPLRTAATPRTSRSRSSSRCPPCRSPARGS